jgi:hypothetical protein
MVYPSYFRGLAVRCLTAARDCCDRQARNEFRKLADEFTVKANELENLLHSRPCPQPRVLEGADPDSGA